MSRQRHVGKSWYFGDISMERSAELLETYGDEGDFIVRDSKTHAGVYVCEVKSASKARRFRIIEENNQFHTDGSDWKFDNLDDLIEHYIRIPPHGKDLKQMVLKKPFVQPLAQPEVNKVPSSKRLSHKVERLKALITQKDQVGPESKEKYLAEVLSKIQRNIPGASYVQEVWHKEKAAIQKSFKKRVRSDSEISEVSPEESFKIKQDSEQCFDTERTLMQSYVDINGGYMELKIKVQEYLYLFVTLKILYEDVKEQAMTLLSDCQKDLLESERKSEDRKTTPPTNAYVLLISPKDMKDKNAYLHRIVKELSEIKRRIQGTIRNAKNDLQEFIDEADRGGQEQSNLRYFSSDLEGMCQITNWMRTETEQSLKEVEKVMDEISGIKNSVSETLTELDGCIQKLLLKYDCRSLQTLSKRKLQKLNHRNTEPKAGKVNSRGTYLATVLKKRTRYAVLRADGNGATLQCPNSAVTLRVPTELNAVVFGHVHTDVKPFLSAIPETECLISPIAEYHCETEDKSKRWFQITIPHCVRNKEDLSDVTVRHGDIHTSVPFTRIPEKTNSGSSDSYFEVNAKSIVIHTTHFSQFICTACGPRTSCFGNGKAFVFGGMTPLAFAPLRASVKLYMCSPLFKIYDYRQKLIEDEQTVRSRRHLIAEEDVLWNPDGYDLSQKAEIVIQMPQNWIARKPIKSNQCERPHDRKLIHSIQLHDMTDMLLCHICKLEASSLATFDFEFQTDHLGTPVGNLSFSGFLQMFLPGRSILDVHVDIFPLQDPARQQTNSDQRCLRKITKMLVCSVENLNDFGLGLGFTQNEILLEMSNNPRSLQTAAWNLACVWWDECHDSHQEKVEILVQVGGNMEKQELVGYIQQAFAVGIQPPVGGHIGNGIGCSMEGNNQIGMDSRSKRNHCVMS